MIKFENISYLQIPSRQEYIDVVITRIFSSINQSLQIVNDLNVKMGSAQESDFDVSLFGFGVNLAIDEAIRNALIHGNDRDPRKVININYTISNDHLKIMIEDQGDGFHVSDLPQQAGNDPSQGRGIILMRNFMDKVTFNEKGNRVTMIKFKKSGGGSRQC
ncbi:MAG: hypothetical protein CVV64_02945 [Candidatus Wallbacteria bacterium HGW-Wallbacteria-1]|jgi:serine/threonine-protein kinase RsbW|uniref:Histidine kinase/HSP90-like ATPase domain-containing protein n=1 Tax=Candidatus Wallbacteria bacterium HGW-Wallbacteria-1 TaxID=2013854 RepID=A0A2N1PTG7_9BACT|nr:MAG: hypothetical protein CVV64_02945 [Candidatus Wallbacteria bacterium HGW-Wallbacteria-1]